MTRLAASPGESVAVWRHLHASGYFQHHPRYQDRLHDLGVARITRLLNLTASDVLLEVGCGYGRLLWHLTPLVRRAIGIDVDEGPIEQARALLADRGDATCLVGDGVSLAGVPDASVDAACAFTVMQHLPRTLVDTYLRECHRVLATSGRLCLQFFHDGSSDRDVRPEVAEQSVSYSASQVCAALERAGFDVVVLERESLEYLGYPPHLTWWWVLAQHRAPAVMEAPGDR